MGPIYVTQTLEDWWIPAICIVDVTLTILVAFVIANQISIWREKVLRNLPATFQDRTILQGTTIVLLVLVASLLGRAILAISVHIIAVIWLAPKIEKHRGRRLAGRQMEQIADLELADLNPQSDEHGRNMSEQDRRSDELSNSSPALARLTEPPPAYTQDVPAHTTHKASEDEYRPGVQNGIIFS